MVDLLKTLTSLAALLALVGTCRAEPLSIRLASGATLALEARAHGARLVVRAAGTAERVVQEMPGERPVGLVWVSPSGAGPGLPLATVAEEGSGGYSHLLLLAADASRVQWELGPAPGAKLEGVTGSGKIVLSRVVRGDRPEGDLTEVARFSLRNGAPSLSPWSLSKPANGWQCLTAGRAAVSHSNWKDAVALLTRAVDSKEGGDEPLGAVSRHELARALLAAGQPERARSLLVGLAKRFPGSFYAKEAARTLELFDATYHAGYRPLVRLVQAEEAVRAGRFTDATRLGEELLRDPGSSALADRVHFFLGQAYAGAGQRKLAVRQYQAIVLYFPQSALRPLANSELSRLELGKGK